ncbi:hypothetical protein K1T71_008495 [Dendrolimus kikuchii]|uniref:Uncharacterized protein n=1 Tax=Dendrolimus kikuchii TaxID=765133 RepID=A0ACC1CXJ7_9NEOP|nr:hypothetical protein K1T71_008495 [Dendrolimus kikuchii]
MLVDYLRNCLELRGTKYMCREAGCGACIVSVKRPGGQVIAVNSCMVAITSCQDWEITTIEHLGSKDDGFHVIQKILAENNGSQCGYCSPSWVMSMYSLLKSKKNLTKLEIEKSFGSNVCRCTGYRPILHAFKKLATDALEAERICVDIEDLDICEKTGKYCRKNCNEEKDWCVVTYDDIDDKDIIEINLKDGKKWFRVSEVDHIFNILQKEGFNSYMLVIGNTAKGAYPIDEYPDTLIDISGVPELKGYKIDQNLIIGVGSTLTELLDIFDAVVKEEYFGYLEQLSEHLQMVAHIPVRNIGSVGGNLMIKHQHNEFPSDVFLLLEAVGAMLSIVYENSTKSKKVTQTVTMQEFLRMKMTGKVILNVMLPPLSKRHRFVSFKIMPRSQNAHAIVNSGYLFEMSSNDCDIVKKCRIVYGGLSSTFIRAYATEVYLSGKNLFTNNTLQSALKVLEDEVVVEENPPEPSAKYRKQLALSLFYKALLTICPTNKIDPSFRSGAIKIHDTRPVSKACQIIDTDPSLWPLNQPIPKLEAFIQCSGEAEYVDDIPKLHDEVFAAFVLSTVPQGEIDNIDPKPALQVPGVLAFYSAKDIPGKNSFLPNNIQLQVASEEALCDGKVKYFNQPIGIIAAESRYLANFAANLVKVTYKNVRKPVIDIKEAKKDPNRTTIFSKIDAKEKGTDDIAKLISGSHTIYGQYYYMMENMVCVTKPSEDGLEVHSSTQWIDGTQTMTAGALKMDTNSIDVYVRRLGGSYGMKVSRSLQVSVACSLVVYKLNRPCRFIQPLTTTTRAVGKRLPCTTDFKVAVNKCGEIQSLDYYLYEDNGYIMSESFTLLDADLYYNCYLQSRWNFKSYDVLTDTPKNSWCRAPGTFESISMAELLMERIAYELSLDPLEVRLANLDTTKYKDIIEMISTIKINSNYDIRRSKTNKFNMDNRWKKRGLRFSLLRWKTQGYGYFEVNLTVFHSDGTVVITHSGIEMGQGINTKAAQVAAYVLNIPVEKVKIKPNISFISSNAYITGGSLGSQSVCIGVRKACETINATLAPIKKQMKNPTWEEVAAKAYELSIDLQAHAFVGKEGAVDYNIFGVALAEVEIDVLTGEHEVLRVDLLQDVGQSVNPALDIGQVEGAFMMGLGYWTCEKLVYTPQGELLTNRTWNYPIPLARDIPQDFRVYFRKNSYSQNSIFGAKATGEPPICLSVVIALALREAISSAREETGISTSEWFNIDGPFTVEAIELSVNNRKEDFKFHVNK